MRAGQSSRVAPLTSVETTSWRRARVHGLSSRQKVPGSSKPHTNRYGREFSKGQVFDHVAKAILKALRLVSRAETRAAIALPDNDSHREEVKQVHDALQKLDISVYWVSFGMFFWDNIGQDEVVAFLRQVLYHLRGHLIALLDNSNTHKGGPLRDLCRSIPRLHLEYFPSYAPDFNPDEAVWALLKGKLANGRPDDLRDLEEQLQKEFRHLAGSQQNLRGCILQSELPFSLQLSLHYYC